MLVTVIVQALGEGILPEFAQVVLKERLKMSE